MYVRLDQPNTALEALSAALGSNPGNTSLLIAVARLHDGLGDMDAGVQVYKDVLFHDSSNVEAIACLGSYHFYSDQPEVALRYYRRLLQMGVTSCQLWNNLGLCTFYASHYDLTLSCFERALATAEEDGESADVWYNLGQLAVGIGDANLGYQAFKVAAALDPDHAEALNNLGVLEARRGADAQVRIGFRAPRQQTRRRR